MIVIRIGVLAFCFFFLTIDSLLYPQQNELRNLDSLDGLWTFVREPATACFQCKSLGVLNRWFEQDLSQFPNSTKMPVPSAYNELTADWNVREHVGWVWYQHTYRPSELPPDSQQILRFGSVQYKAVVYVNGKQAIKHVGGHVPFEVRLPPYEKRIVYRITVAVDNTLHEGTVPPGKLITSRIGNATQVHAIPGFDFFNYAGILRSVVAQTLSDLHLKRLRIWTTKPNIVNYNLTISQPSFSDPDGVVKVSVCLRDPRGQQLIQCVSAPNSLAPVEEPELWWPRGYGPQPLYTIEVLIYVDRVLIDVYRETFGFRWVHVQDGRVHVNDRPFYCVGFGMHEDFHLHGRGYDPVVMIRDLNMLEWMNANCYRTSHYPYNEQRAYEADRRGIVVITEAPAVGILNFNDQTLQLHRQMIEEMIERDFTHPSVIAWSLTNEPHVSDKPECLDYFRSISSFARQLDSTRPIAAVYGTGGPVDAPVATVDLFDFIGLNLYIGWYVHMSELDVIENGVYEVISSWHKVNNKTLIVTEYGAEALPGMYAQPSLLFSEQYQEAVIQRNHGAFDRLIRENAMAGEMIWNFADFMTANDLTRPGGNHKGVLTRDRQPKHSSGVMRERYGRLGRALNEVDG